MNVGTNFPFPIHCNGLIANLLLFHSDENSSDFLIEKNRILSNFQDAIQIVQSGE